jgi:hypothetical protein
MSTRPNLHMMVFLLSEAATHTCAGHPASLPSTLANLAPTPRNGKERPLESWVTGEIKYAAHNEYKGKNRVEKSLVDNGRLKPLVISISHQCIQFRLG